MSPRTRFTQTSFLPGLSCLAVFLLLAAVASAACRQQGEGQTGFAGRYATSEWHLEGLVTVTVREGQLTFQPVFWRPARLLRPVSSDLFQMEDRPDRTMQFRRDAEGCVVDLVVSGMSYKSPLRRVADSEALPIELLLRGRAVEAAKALSSAAAGDGGKLAELGQRMLNVPAEWRSAAAFLAAAVELHPKNAGLEAALADARMALGMRTKAIDSYRRALELGPNLASAKRSLETLGVLKSEVSGWKLPFTTAALFAPAATAEIERVEADWRQRDLSAKQAEVVAREKVTIGGVAMEMRIVSHDVLGSRHFGAIFVPEQPGPRCCGVVLEAKGVSWNFFPLTVPGGLTSLQFLGDDLRNLIVAAPGFRGEQLRAGGIEFQSEGDRTNAWDGAADDLLALLHVTLAMVPEADPKRVCTFGRSRGGSVALLAGARDRRIACVVSWAAPADWFELMGLQGWSQRELAEEGLRYRSAPNQTGGQFINYFLRRAIDRGEPLDAVRRKLIAGSPLYFTRTLPATQLHYGIDDSIVPQRNGREIARRFRAAGGKRCLEEFFHPGAGHDQDLIVAPRESRAFLRRYLIDGGSAGCRPVTN